MWFARRSCAEILRENKRMPASKIRKCCACQKPGHFARECQSKHKGSHSTSPTRNSQRKIQRTGAKLKRVSTAGQRLPPKFSGITQSKRSSICLTIDGKFQGSFHHDGHWCFSFNYRQYNSQRKIRRFRTATGDEAAFKGKIIRNISISDVLMKHKFLVADIIDELIQGMEFMAKHSFVLDMKRQVLQYVNATLPLTVGYDRQAEVLQVKQDMKSSCLTGTQFNTSTGIKPNQRYNKSSKRGHHSAMPKSRVRGKSSNRNTKNMLKDIRRG
uniref:CCHC-type domain-containing protein n=1 Tax=Glossina austeni TaxID=7395 RepID=A0A1A9VJA8_GLOAU